MRLPNGQLLGYCTNVHPYHSATGLVSALREFAAPLRERLGLTQALGVGLWLPEAVAREVAAEPAPLRAVLAELGLLAFTVNAFPQGDFHGERVKDRVFRPSWAQRERLDYTLVAAQALAALLPEGETGSISTHSGAYKLWGPEANAPEPIAAGLLAAARGLARLEQRTGRRIVLAVEPEPLSFLETTDEVVEFFTRQLLSDSEAARRHLGLCYDACHQAVEGEHMADSLSALRRAGVPVAKVQLSSALVLPDPGAHRRLLAPFADDRWFHQVVVEQADGSLRRLPDLPEALADAQAATARAWRVHLHVPLFADPLDDAGHLRTTRPQLEELLAQVVDVAVTPHLEIETYSFGLLSAERRAALGTPDLLTCLHREFRWVLERHEGAVKQRARSNAGPGSS